MQRDSAARFSHDHRPCTGVLLVNLGTPDQPTTAAVRRYLAEFLWDRRIVEIPRLIWWLILHGIILRLRPRQSAERYKGVWTEDGSPLLAIGRRQLAALETRLEQQCPGPVKLALGMRYGNPSIASALRELQAADARRLLVLPLYPQYAASTVASTFDKVTEELARWRWLPEWRMITHYHDQPDYIAALAASIRDAWQEQPPAEKLLFSFHGVPKRSLLAGDPYHCECHKTARLVAEALELPSDRWAVSFQSRFGRAEWLQPYTSELLKDWARQGISSVDVICPGFSADCLETLEEITDENRTFYLEAGGKQFRYIPALNDRDDHIEALHNLILHHTQGWPETDQRLSRPNDAELQATRQRAEALGADQ